MSCANPSAGSKAILPVASPTASCRPRLPRARRCFRSLTRWPLPSVTLVGAGFMLADADLRLLVPLLVWLVGYLAADALDAPPRSARRRRRRRDARSAVTGRVVDAYTNIHSVKLFAHHERERDYASEAIEVARQAVADRNAHRHQDGCDADRSERVSDRGRDRLGDVAVVSGRWPSVGTVAAAAALVLRLNNMTYWIMWATTNLVKTWASCMKGWRRSPIRSPWSTHPQAPDAGFPRRSDRN